MSARRRFRSLLLPFALVLAVPTVAPATPAAAAEPAYAVTPVATGLSIPWDVTWVGDLMLFNERAGRLWSKRGDAAPQAVSLPLPPIFARSEGGLLGMVADPAASSNGNFYTCMSVAKASTVWTCVMMSRFLPGRSWTSTCANGSSRAPNLEVVLRTPLATARTNPN